MTHALMSALGFEVEYDAKHIGDSHYGHEPSQLCPLCDQPMMAGEKLRVMHTSIRAHEDVAEMVHYDCFVAAVDDDED